MFGNTEKPMTHGSLFSGIGGFDLAAEWMGWENKFHCEMNEFGRRVLNYYWPESISYEDICTTDFTIWRGKIDVLSGGFPCQPFSTAGKREGTDDSRYLWPQMLRVVREVRPKWIVGENVLGLVSWNEGMVFETVCNDLENEGFKVIPIVLAAASVNAPHKRDRIFFVAKNTLLDGCVQRKFGEEGSEVWTQRNVSARVEDRFYLQERTSTDTDNPRDTTSECGTDREWKKEEQNRNTTQRELSGSEYKGDVTNALCGGLQADNSLRKSERQEHNPWMVGEDYVADTERIRLEHGKDSSEVGGGQTEVGRSGSISSYVSKADGNAEESSHSNSKVLEHRNREGKTGGRANEKKRIESFNRTGSWEIFPTVSPVCFRDDGLSNRLDGITLPKWRKESIKAAGNAVVPQLIFNLFKTIENDAF